MHLLLHISLGAELATVRLVLLLDVNMPLVGLKPFSRGQSDATNIALNGDSAVNLHVQLQGSFIVEELATGIAAELVGLVL